MTTVSDGRPLHRPASVCRALLAALDAAEGRRRARKRNQTPDAIGLAVKRGLLECVARDDPAPYEFEAWLLRYVAAQGTGEAGSSALAMARAVLDEWRLAHAMPEFAAWLAQGAPSADAGEGAHVDEAAREAFGSGHPAPPGAPTI